MSMQQFDIGDTVKFSTTFKNAAGAVADPTTIVGKVKNPAGTITTYTSGVDVELVKDGTGLYHINIPLPTAGPWAARLTGTGTVAAAAEMTWKVLSGEFS